jgi:hypothetical protein
MEICFVIQPFDSAKYDKRYDDIYRPAIEAAGFEPYRVDKDVSVSIPIDAIETGIRKAAICLADITADNPNVWYELGYAFAIGRPVVMVCSEERTGKKYPFDIQHRSIIEYLADAPSDFSRLHEKLVAKLKALGEKGELLRNIAASDLITPVQGLSPSEVMVFAVLAGSCSLVDSSISYYGCKRDAEQANVTSVGFNLAIRRLLAKNFVELRQLYDETDGESYQAIQITENGWTWLEANDSQFILHRSPTTAGDDELPF